MAASQTSISKTDFQILSDALMKIKWWSWPDYLINQSIPFLCSDDIDEFIAYASQFDQTTKQITSSIVSKISEKDIFHQGCWSMLANNF